MEVEVEVAVVVEGGVVALVALIWSAMSVVSLGILPVSADCVLVVVVVLVEDAVVAALDIAGAQVTVEGELHMQTALFII